MSRLLAFVLVIGMVTVNSLSAVPTSGEQVLTVAFLYNFLKLTEWPIGALNDELTLRVTNNAPFGSELDSVSVRSAQNKAVRVKRIDLEESPSRCQLVFLPWEEKTMRTREWLNNYANGQIIRQIR